MSDKALPWSLGWTRDGPELLSSLLPRTRSHGAQAGLQLALQLMITPDFPSTGLSCTLGSKDTSREGILPTDAHLSPTLALSSSRTPTDPPQSTALNVTWHLETFL